MTYVHFSSNLRYSKKKGWARLFLQYEQPNQIEDSSTKFVTEDIFSFHQSQNTETLLVFLQQLCTQSNTYTSISLFCNHTQASKKNIRRECYYIRKRYCKFICWWAKKHLSNRYFKLYQILWRIIGINRIKSLFCAIELFFLEYFVILFLQFTTNPDGKVSLSGGNAGRK